MSYKVFNVCLISPITVKKEDLKIALDKLGKISGLSVEVFKTTTVNGEEYVRVEGGKDED